MEFAKAIVQTVEERLKSLKEQINQLDEDEIDSIIKSAKARLTNAHIAFGGIIIEEASN